MWESNNDYYKLNIENVISLACDQNKCLLLLGNGQVYSCELIFPNNINDTLQQVMHLTNIIAISYDSDNCLAVDTKGYVYIWEYKFKIILL